MTTESVLQFVKKVGASPNLQQQLDSLNGDLDGLVKLAAQAGNEFTPNQWMETVTALRAGDELNGEQMNQVVGGVTTVNATYAPSMADINARFACFPPIGTIDVMKGR